MDRYLVRAFAGAVVGLAVLSACSTQPSAETGENGWVSLGNAVSKRCDGTTLIYAADKATSSGHALAIVVDSPECDDKVTNPN